VQVKHFIRFWWTAKRLPAGRRGSALAIDRSRPAGDYHLLPPAGRTRRRASENQGFEPRFPAVNEPVVILYTRHGCHLCEVARTVLERHGLRPQEVDIESDPALLARYTNDIPVVSIDGIERFRGRVDELLLRRLLAGRSGGT
jgi:glutaredoxin